MHVATVQNDEVFQPAAHVELAAAQIAHVPGVQPSVAERVRGRDRIVEIPGHDRRATYADFSLDAGGTRPAEAVDDGHFLSRERPPARQVIRARRPGTRWLGDAAI